MISRSRALVSLMRQPTSALKKKLYIAASFFFFCHSCPVFSVLYCVEQVKFNCTSFESFILKTLIGVSQQNASERVCVCVERASFFCPVCLLAFANKSKWSSVCTLECEVIIVLWDSNFWFVCDAQFSTPSQYHIYIMGWTGILKSILTGTRHRRTPYNTMEITGE